MTSTFLVFGKYYLLLICTSLMVIAISIAIDVNLTTRSAPSGYAYV